MYYKGIPEEFVEMQLNGCSNLCQLDKFRDLLKDEMFDSDEEIICDNDPVPRQDLYY